MIQAIQILITRAEGSTELCTTKRFVGNSLWSQASRWLRDQSHTYPATGGYDKHDFIITFADGEIYEGRLDCKHYTCEDNDLNLSQHITQYLRRLSGRSFPYGKSQEEWETYLKMLEGRQPGIREWAAKFLDTYALSDNTTFYEPLTHIFLTKLNNPDSVVVFLQTENLHFPITLMAISQDAFSKLAVSDDHTRYWMKGKP